VKDPNFDYTQSDNLVKYIYPLRKPKFEGPFFDENGAPLTEDDFYLGPDGEWIRNPVSDTEDEPFISWSKRSYADQ
jgi:hypothetical protein